MKSDLPKPLHKVRGRSLLAWVIHALDATHVDAVSVVVGHGRDLVVESLKQDFTRNFYFAEQLSQRGTGDAAAVGLAELDLHDSGYGDDDHVLVLAGDTPLLTGETVASLIETHRSQGAAATVVTAFVDDPTGYGRIQRTERGGVGSIVEHRDATQEQLAINEINGGMYCFRRSLLAPALRLISTDNSQGEMYLTDAIGVLVEAGHVVVPFIADPIEISGVNDRAQLGAVGVHLAERIAQEHMRQGVTIVQPSSTVIDADVQIGEDAVVHASTVIEGASVIGAGAIVGPNSHLVDAIVGDRAHVKSSVVRGSTIAPDEIVGPFANIREQ